MKRHLGIMAVVAALAVGLTGCVYITGASPDSQKIVEMRPGEKVLFKVVGPVNTPTTKCVWHVDRIRGNLNNDYSNGPEWQNEFLFEADPLGESTNRIIVTCDAYSFGLGFQDRTGLPLLTFAWWLKDSRSWEVRIHQDISPIWQGTYCIRDDTDVQMLKGYTDVTGNLLICSPKWIPIPTNLSTLEDLNTLTTVGGDLIIENSASLTSLAGLQNLTSVGGNISIKANPALTSLAGLQNLTVVRGDLLIAENNVLPNLSGLQNLTIVEGDLEIGTTDGYNNNSLTNLTGLDNLTSVGGNFSIEHNYALTSLVGLQNLTSVGGNISIDLNPALTSLAGLQNLTVVRGNLFIAENNVLPNLCGLQNLTIVEGDLIIGWLSACNSFLTSLTGLENLTSVGGDVSISNNIALTSLADLRNLATVGSLDISGNFILTDLGLVSLRSVTYYYGVSFNPTLCSFLAEELRDQVLAAGGIGGEIRIAGNKDCPKP